MQFLSRLILLLLLAGAIVFLGKYGPGHVIVFIGDYRLDFALSSLLIAIILVFIFIYYSIRFIANINQMPSRLKKWRLAHQLLQSRKFLNNSGINYFEGKFGSSYKNAINSIGKETNKENQFVALMLAYKASGFMRNYDKEEELIGKLDGFKDKKWQLAKYVAIAENQYYRRLYGKCLDNLNQAINIDKRHILARRIKLKTYIHLKNFDKAFEELLWLTRNNYLESHKELSYKLTVYTNLFESVGDAAELNHFYRKLDKVDKENPIIIKCYLLALIRLKNIDGAIVVFENILADKFTLFDIMIKLAKILVNSREIERLMRVAQQLSVTNIRDANLLLVIGICNYKLNKYNEARNCIEYSIKVRESIDALMYLLFIASAVNDNILHTVTEQKLKELMSNVRYG
ncbi:MAG: hypothetical protein K2P99_02465 [Burkholderiales bacterium]|nr:hypothetical protein [Burkholderiales bacterium]